MCQWHPDPDVELTRVYQKRSLNVFLDDEGLRPYRWLRDSRAYIKVAGRCIALNVMFNCHYDSLRLYFRIWLFIYDVNWGTVTCFDINHFLLIWHFRKLLRRCYDIFLIRCLMIINFLRTLLRSWPDFYIVSWGKNLRWLHWNVHIAIALILFGQVCKRRLLSFLHCSMH